MCSLIYWTLLDHSENWLNVILIVKDFETFVLPTAQLYTLAKLRTYKKFPA